MNLTLVVRVISELGTTGGLRLDLSQRDFMADLDDFRFRSHELLVDIDSATTKIMMMVVSKKVSGLEWDEAIKKHHDAFEAWNSFLNSPITPPNDES